MYYNDYGSYGRYTYDQTTPFTSIMDTSTAVQQTQTTDIFTYPQNFQNFRYSRQ